jgi:hypothetical protein
VADALNRKAHEVHIATISIYKTDLKDKIVATTIPDQNYSKVKETLQQGNFQQKFNYYELKEDRIIMYKGKVYVSNSSEMKNAVLKEMHNVPYARHLRYQKTIAAVRRKYFWPRMKKEVANYIARCLEYQKVKTKHRHPTCFL